MLLSGKVLQPVRAHAVCQGPLLVDGFRAERRSGVEKTHWESDLCRRASYRMIPAATAALRDSTAIVGIERSSAPLRRASLTPRPSLPITIAQRRRRSTFGREA